MSRNFQMYEFLCHCCEAGADIVKPELIAALQRVRDDYAVPLIIDCGYRCAKHNAEVGGAENSAHLTGQAADILDIRGSLKVWMTVERLESYGLWAEDYFKTPGWIHLQVRPAKHRIFLP